MIYGKTYKVPFWIVVNEASARKTKKIVECLDGMGAKVKPNLGQNFKDFLMTFRKRGYAEHLPESYPFVLDPMLLLRAASEHAKNSIGPASQLGNTLSVPVHRLNRRMEDDSSFERVFNELLELEAPIGLSQIFQIGEDCHAGKSKDVRAFFTQGPISKNLLTKVADKVITIGDGADNDINVGECKIEEIESVLNNYFQEKQQ